MASVQKSAKQGEVLLRKLYAAGDVIFREGDEGSVAYVIQAGSVEIVKDRDGKPALLGTLGEGAIFGEMALIDNAPRMGTARAATPTTVIIVSGDKFRKKISQADPVIGKLLLILVQNIRSLAAADLKILEE